MSFTPIDLDRLPPPEFIDQPDFADILAARKTRLLEVAKDLGASEAELAEAAAALELESEPLVQILQEDSYREVGLRAEVQDAGMERLLAFASDGNLDHIAVEFGVERAVVIPADPSANPPVQEVQESDARLRRRTQLAPESYTTCGTEGMLIYWALNASPLVKSVKPVSPAPAQVILTILSTEGDGTASQELIDTVLREVEPRSPLGTQVLVQSAEILTYEAHAMITVFDGPDAEVLREASEEDLRAFTEERHQLGHDITIAGLHGAIWQANLHNISLGDFAADLIVEPHQAAYCTGLSVTIGGRDV
ncbi:hypothetical protein BWR17_18145 (plasmid) [Phaeobacter inhibens]|uniref:baseplate assembly protein n=1 Tax=Phaeobacter inhibens TaxID=221822 RepID=UPI000971A68C|nr:baseplate J/gp47 family protein [Phaeobacter inhibens]APX17812.1 hypothetical protein BWR17_18145 [Phaeobacter inhibens]